MDREQFIKKLEAELWEYVEKLEGLGWPAYAEFIEQAKTVTYLDGVIKSIKVDGITEDQIEYLLRSDTPLADVAYTWIEMEEHAVDFYTAQNAIHDIVDRDMFNAAFEDQPIHEIGNQQTQPDLENDLIDEMHLGDFFSKVQADYDRMNKALDTRQSRLDNQTIGEARSLANEDIFNLPVDRHRIERLYDMLMGPEDHFSPEEIAYLAKDDHPLDRVYGYWKSLLMEDENASFELAVYTMIGEDYLHLRTTQTLPVCENNRAYFYRKENDVSAIRHNADASGGEPFRVHKVVVLSSAMYGIFTRNLLQDFSFISNNKNTLRTGDMTNCVMICCNERPEGILVAAEGYNYARYTAYVHDRNKLNLQNTPVEERNPYSEIVDIKRLLHDWRRNLTIAEMQGLLCAIGEIIDSRIESPEKNDVCYLFNNCDMAFAGIVGDAAGVKDINGVPLCIGDVTEAPEASNPAHTPYLLPKIVYSRPDGTVFPSQDSIDEGGITKISDFSESMMVARAQDIDVLSCLDSYRKAKSVLDRMRHKDEKNLTPPDKVI